MSSTINAVVGMGPPRRASGGVIAHPATVAASLPSSRMAARDRAQSWRGKYLRALNICPEDIELARRNAEKAASGNKPRVRAMSFHRSDYPDQLALSRSYSSSTEKEDQERKSLEKSTQNHHHATDQGHFAAHRAIPQQHHIRAVPLRAPSTSHQRPAISSSAMPIAPTAANPYGFAMRPNMARGRRCHTDPFELQERVSAPIQIPSAMGGNNQLDGNDRHDKYASGGQRRRVSPQAPQSDHRDVVANTNHTPNVRLLSWEEPVAMLAAADAVTNGWRMPHASAMSSMELGVRRGRRDEQLHHEDRMDEYDEEDDHDSHGGDIFEMDDSEGDDNQITSQTVPPMTTSKSRRRYRTESMNIVTSGREKRTHHDYDDLDDMDHHGHHHVVSQSFVPPHQLVDRSNCFSIGLRDELKKRRPANPI